jgi:DNA modification methylase
MPLSRIRRARRNPKEHDLGAIHKSIDDHGFTAPLLWDETTGALVAGHGRLEALEQRRRSGKAAPGRIQVKGKEWLVPVIRGIRFASEGEAEAYLLADNHIVELGGWNDSELSNVLQDLGKAGLLEKSSYDGEDLDRLLKDLDIQGDAKAANDIPEVPKKPVAKRGEIWKLGDHLVYCGDSTKIEEIRKALGKLSGSPDRAGLYLADPPYAIFGSSTGVSGEVTDDKIVRPFFEILLRNASEILPTFGHVYICCDWRTWPAIWESAKGSGLLPKNLLVWDKGGGGLGSSYSMTYETIGFFSKIPKRAIMSSVKAGQRTVRRPNLIRANRVSSSTRKHNAAKPVEVFEELIKNSSDKGAVVLDPFLGSGTTIIAAEQQERRAVGLEIEPRFVDVTVERWQTISGKKATRL